MASKLGNPPSLTTYLLASQPQDFTTATQSPFLSHAANGTLGLQKIGLWLSHDRLYMHHYLHGLGRLISLAARCLPREAALSASSPASKLIDWLSDALDGLRREERFFVEIADEFGFSLETESYDGTIPAVGEFERIFGGIPTGADDGKAHVQLAWLEGAVVFWATEKCYLEAWSWAKSQVGNAGTEEVKGEVEQGLDVSAMTTRLISNWTSDEFVVFVNRLGDIIDDGVRAELEWRPSEEEGIRLRALAAWRQVLGAEARFWPEVS